MAKKKLSDEEQVAQYMEALQHPLLAEIKAVREILRRSAGGRLSERIKWNAPSYYYQQDLVTFNSRAEQHVHLVFHHPYIVEIVSPILEGDYKDRRMAYFRTMDEVNANEAELERIMSELAERIDS